MKNRLWLILYIGLIIVLFQNNLTAQDNGDLTLTLQDQLLTDQDGDGLADPGDTIRYTARVTNCGTSAVANVQMNASLDPNTTLNQGSVQVGTPQAAGDCPPDAQTTGGAQTTPSPTPSPTPTLIVPIDPSIPSVTATTPANGSTEVALTLAPTITFSEAVTVNGDWFQMVCSLSGTFNLSSATVTVTGGPTTFTLDPNTDLRSGETCTITVNAGQVRAQDNNVAMAANYVFAFTTETPPTITATTPINGALGVGNNNNLIVTFDEPVTVTPASFRLECPIGTPIPFTVTGSGTATITLDPTGSLPSGAICTVTAVAANISDVDTADAPDLLDGNGDNTAGDDYTFAFTTGVDAAPAVQTISPVNGAVSVRTNATITITFDEVVEIASPAAFGLECPASTPVAFTVTTPAALPAAATTFVLTPTSRLPANTLCTVRVFAAQVTDTDLIDPPNTLAADFVATFTTDAPPSVTSTTPLNAAAGIATNSSIVINFNEPVTVTPASFTLECPIGTPVPFVILGGGTNSITLDPTGSLPATTTCTVRVVAAQVADFIDPPDTMLADYTFTFDTIADTVPSVISTTPIDAATGIASGSNITVTFSEPVDVTAGAFTLECPIGSAIPFTVIPALPATNATVFTLDPTGNLPASTPCRVGVAAASVTDTDTDDPPNTLAANYTFTFTTDIDAAPAVQSIVPADGAVSVGTTTPITITFDEPVNISSAAAFSLECPLFTPLGFTVTTPAILPASATTFVLTPTAPLPVNEQCRVIVFALSVTDTDTLDPNDNMAADFVATFTTDTAPNVTGTTPANGDTGVGTGSNIGIDFSEPVTVTTASFTLQCPTGTPVTFAVSGSGTSSITLDPTGNLPASTLCTVRVIAAQVADLDSGDPPDALAADYIFTFNTLVDAAPTVDQANISPASTSTGTNSAAITGRVSTTPTITLPFSEPINAATGAITLDCAGPVSVTVIPGLPAVNTTSLAVSPTAALSPGANCVLTVVAANISDTDSNDPPNLLAANYTVSFTVDTAPAATLTETEVGGAFQNVTGAGAANVDLDSDLRITFTEAVTVTFPANGLQCPAGNPMPVTVTTNNAATIVLNPNANLPLNTTCVLNIPAANISDTDTADAPDNPAAAVSHTFTTVDDDAPTVTTNPANGGGNIAVNTNLTVTFNEPVTLTGAWFNLTCTVSGSRVSTGELTGTGINIIENTPDRIYTIDPTADFATGDQCTITIDSANVVDNDAIDPPNQLDGNANLDIVDGDPDDYVATFSTADMAPRVTGTTPTAAAVVAADQVVTLNFSEPVNIATGAFTWQCPAGTPITGDFTTSVPLPANGVTSIQLTPVNPLPFGAACVVIAESTLVTDADPVDPPQELDGDSSNDVADGDADDFSLAFTVDAQPTVISTQVQIGGVLSPASGAINVDPNTNIVMTFSEPVTVTLASFDLECPAGADIPFTLTGDGTTTITLDPTPAFLAVNALCDFDIIAANISDTDTVDAPDLLNANANLTFRIVNDDAPTVVSAAVEVGNVFTTLPLTGVFADTDTNLRLTFSEAVNPTGNWAALVCTSSGTQSVGGGTLGVTDADPVFTLNPNTNLTPGESCTLTVFAAQVNDDDAIDPPANLPANAVYTFMVQDVPPQVNAGTSTPDNNAIVPNNQTVTLNFTEMVDIAAGGITWQCGASNVAFTPALPQSNVTTLTLTPTTTLTSGASCTVTLESTLITDDDAADGPDELDGNANNDVTNGDADDFTRTFTVDSPPSLPTTPRVTVGGTLQFVPISGVDLNTNIILTFNENITATTAAITLTCDGSPIAFTGLPVSNASVITLDPVADLPGGATCDITVFSSAALTDTDAFDPPNQFDGNGDGVEGDSFIFGFQTRTQPVNDAYTITPHLTYVSPAGVRANDTPATLTVTGFGSTAGTATTTPNGTNFITATGAGGRVVMNADGTFTFYPDASDDNTDGTATFFYRVTGGATASVTLTFEAEQFVWFVDQSPGSAVCTGTNNGTQACPEDTLADVAAADTINDVIFIDEGNYTCGITLLNDEIVIGDGSSGTLAALAASRVTPVAGSDFAPYNTFGGIDPVLTSPAGDCFIVNANNTVRGVTINNTPTGHGFQDDGVSVGTLTLAEVSFSGTGGIFNLANGGTINAALGSMTSSSSPSAPILLTNIGGTITQTGGGTITHTGNFDLFDVNGGTVGGSISAALTATAGNGSVIDITNGHTGNFTFSGAITSSGTYAGNNFQFNNADGGYTFSGIVDLLEGTAGVNIENGSGGTFTSTNTDSDIEGIQGIPFRINTSTMAVNYDGDITHRNGVGSLLSARVVEIITSTGVISFDGTIAAGDSGNRATGATIFLQDTGSANAITFNYVDTTVGNAPAFVSSVSGSVVMNRLRANCDGNIGADNHCIDIADTTTSNFTMEALRVDYDDAGEAGGAISLVNTPGIWTIEDTTLGTGFGLTGRNAIMVYGLNFGTLNLATVDSPSSPGGLTPSFVTANNRAAFDLTNGAINITVTELNVIDATDHGINLVNVSGPLFRATGNVTLSGAVGSNQLINIGADSTANAFAGTQSVTTTTIDIGTNGTINNDVTLNQRRTTAVRLGNFNGTQARFGNLIIPSSPGATGNGVEHLSSDGNLTFRTVDIDLAASLSTPETQSTPGYPNANEISDGNGILIEGSNGRLTIANSGTIDNTIGGDGEAIDARRSGGVTLNNLTVNQTGGDGLQFADMTGNSFLNNVHITDYGVALAPPARGVVIRNQANAGGDFNFVDLDILQSDFVNETNALVDFGALNSAAGNISLSFTETGAGLCNLVGLANNSVTGTVGAPGLLIRPNGLQVVGVLVNNCTFNRISNLTFQPQGSAQLTGTVQNNSLTAIEHTSVNAAAVVNFLTENSASLEMTFAANLVALETACCPNPGQPTNGLVEGIRLRMADNSRANLNIDNNNIGPVSGSAIFINPANTATNNVLIANNEIGSIAATEIRNRGIAYDALTATGTTNLLVQNNVIGRAGAGVGADGDGMRFRGEGTATSNLTILANTVYSATANAFTVRTADSAVMCLDIRNNFPQAVGGGAFGIALVEFSGNMQVEGPGAGVVAPVDLTAAQAGGAANTADVAGTPTFNGGANCTEPPPPGASYTFHGYPPSTIVQLTPAAGAVTDTAAAFPADLLNAVLSFGANVASAQAPAAVTIPFGTIPANSTVSATFDVVIGQNIGRSVNAVTLQGTLIGLNVVSNDPDTQQANDATITLLDPLRNVRELPATGQIPWWRDVVIGLVGLSMLAALVMVWRRLRVMQAR